MNTYFDHTYTADTNFKFMKRLKRLGFNLDANKVEHPHSKCRFITFDNSQYLEFIHPIGNTGHYDRPGISFGYKGSLKRFYDKKVKQGAELSFFHRNYQWKENSKYILPGWNFVQFKRTGIRTIFMWLTEYELINGKKRPTKKANHPNGVNRIVGHEFVINSKGRKIFELITGKKFKDKIEFSNGVVFYFTEGRTNLHKSVILKSSNAEKTKKYIKAIRFDYRGQQAVRILNTCLKKRMWDIIVIL